jgi:hypothetical protein
MVSPIHYYPRTDPSKIRSKSRQRLIPAQSLNGLAKLSFNGTPEGRGHDQLSMPTSQPEWTGRGIC